MTATEDSARQIELVRQLRLQNLLALYSIPESYASLLPTEISWDDVRDEIHSLILHTVQTDAHGVLKTEGVSRETIEFQSFIG